VATRVGVTDAGRRRGGDGHTSAGIGVQLVVDRRGQRRVLAAGEGGGRGGGGAERVRRRRRRRGRPRGVGGIGGGATNSVSFCQFIYLIDCLFLIVFLFSDLGSAGEIGSFGESRKLS